MKECDYCGLTILMARSIKTGKWAALDPMDQEAIARNEFHSCEPYKDRR